LFGVGKYGEAVGQANQYGSWFNSYSDSVIGVDSNAIEEGIEKGSN